MALKFVRPVCLVLSSVSILLGGMALYLSYHALQVDSYVMLQAAPAGFVAGSVLIGSGLVCLTLLATLPTTAGRREEGHDVSGPSRQRWQPSDQRN